MSSLNPLHPWYFQKQRPVGCISSRHAVWNREDIYFKNTLLYRALYFCFICCLCSAVRLDKTSIIFFSSVPEIEVVHRNYLIRNLMQRKEKMISKEKKIAIHKSPLVPTLEFVASKILLRIYLTVVSYNVQTIK